VGIDPTTYLTTQQAADRLGITDSTVRAQIGKGKLEARTFASILLIAPAEVERYARENQPARRGGRPSKRGTRSG
jgi:excisionase family DNA binding protein